MRGIEFYVDGVDHFGDGETFFFVSGNVGFVFEREPNVVEAFQEAALAERIDFK